MTESIYCSIRKMWVAALPEEIIRQRLITHMIQNLSFPSSSLAVEKGLKQMPHLTLLPGDIPDRRADLVCFAKGIHPDHSLYPLLLIECKAVPLNSKVMHQVMGYNHFLKAHFIAAANENEIRLGWLDKTFQTYQFIPYLPSYTDLLKKTRLLA